MRRDLQFICQPLSTCFMLNVAQALHKETRASIFPATLPILIYNLITKEKQKYFHLLNSWNVVHATFLPLL